MVIFGPIGLPINLNVNEATIFNFRPKIGQL